jgi:apolipoprotein N-acyltransferase
MKQGADRTWTHGASVAAGWCGREYRPRVNVAEAFLLLAVVVLPAPLGVLAALARKPWWWAAVAAVGLTMIAAIAPTPEVGESRVAAGDLVFLLVVALWVAGLAWLGFFLARRFWVSRDESTAAP